MLPSVLEHLDENLKIDGIKAHVDEIKKGSLWKFSLLV